MKKPYGFRLDEGYPIPDEFIDGAAIAVQGVMNLYPKYQGTPRDYATKVLTVHLYLIFEIDGRYYIRLEDGAIAKRASFSFDPSDGVWQRRINYSSHPISKDEAFARLAVFFTNPFPVEHVTDAAIDMAWRVLHVQQG